MKYILPSPEQYTQGLFRKLVIAQLAGEELKAERIHSQMQGFVHAMGRIESYHDNRSKK
jgi:hypothetical protein